ncbi:copper transporter [Brevibacillus sp. NRS-1366]|uniref:copper transporter n=1 Tax=Brevibacillus sp. NRS-1366 TaxID=3233899 RepID=UPI003D1E2FDC
MIHFRYHLISLAAVFVALGVGILLGGTAGHNWFSLGEKEVLANMSAKYDRALKSNQELKQQMNRLLVEVERNKEEVIHLMTLRYANDLQGSKVYVWQEENESIERITRLMQSVGIKVVPYREGRVPADSLLLVFANKTPDWLAQWPKTGRWLLVQQEPDSVIKQWALLESLQKLLSETREEREKS